MSTFQQMPYEELNRWIAAAQGGQMAVDERQRRLLSGDATWLALKRAVEELSRIAPQDHDVVLRVGDLTVLEARYIEPHTFLFGGMADDGSHSWIVMHFSQVVFRVIHRAKRRQCLGIWSYLFEVGGILGAKHAAKTDAFVSAFLGQSGPSGAAKSFLVEVASRMPQAHSLDSMKLFDYIGADVAGRMSYKGDGWHTLFTERGTQKIPAEVALTNSWEYASSGAALGTTHPDVLRAMFDRTYAPVPGGRWQQAYAAGLDIGPEQPRTNYREAEDAENKKFMDFCQKFRPDLYSLLRD